MGSMGHGATIIGSAEQANALKEKLEDQCSKPVPKLSCDYLLSAYHDFYVKNGGLQKTITAYKNDLDSLNVIRQRNGIMDIDIHEQNVQYLKDKFKKDTKYVLSSFNLSEDKIPDFLDDIIYTKPVKAVMINLSEITGLYLNKNALAEKYYDFQETDTDKQHQKGFFKANQKNAFAMIRDDFRRIGVDANITHRPDYSRGHKNGVVLFVTDEKQFQKFIDHAVATDLISINDLKEAEGGRSYLKNLKDEDIWVDKDAMIKSMIAKHSDHLTDKDGVAVKPLALYK